MDDFPTALSLVIDRAAFEEDCERAAGVVTALTAPRTCRPHDSFDARRLLLTGAVGLNWDETRFLAESDRSPLEDRPWSPAPRRARPDRVVRPGRGAATPGADPADPTVEPGDGP